MDSESANESEDRGGPKSRSRKIENSIQPPFRNPVGAQTLARLWPVGGPARLSHDNLACLCACVRLRACKPACLLTYLRACLRACRRAGVHERMRSWECACACVSVVCVWAFVGVSVR
eukprot:15437541-Alexandrium_andersonii.AAC.1